MNIKKGINESAFPEGLNYKEIFEITKKAGFEGIEMNYFFETGRLNTKSSNSYLEEIKGFSENFNLKIPSLLCAETYRLLPTTSLKEKTRLINLIENAFIVCKKFGSDTLLICEGWINENIGYLEGYKNSLKFFKEISKIAEDYKVYIGIENVRNKFLLTPLSFLNFIKEIGSKYIRIYFDTGNVIGYGYPDDWIETLKDYIVQIHIKDFKERENIFVSILDGDVDWLRFKKILSKIKYSGFLIVEKSQHPFFPIEDIYLNSIKLDIILGNFKI
ncbi:MAG: sugar phosphate isomerase/epimerase [Candidatus Omnitrophica bacterium]|nr:sugar phosphate isomerase/epimerase [Candidatus Omnitrophota bacterium]